MIAEIEGNFPAGHSEIKSLYMCAYLINQESGLGKKAETQRPQKAETQRPPIDQLINFLLTFPKIPVFWVGSETLIQVSFFGHGFLR